MKTQEIFQSAIVMGLALMLLIGVATSVRASDPWPWGQGIPWLTTTPWATPYVLHVGERFSFGVAIVPATPIPIPTPLNVPAPSRPVSPGGSGSNFAPVVAAASLPTPVSPAVNARGGDSPLNALIPDGVPRTVAAGASLWYKVGNGGEHIEVFLDSPLLSGMSLLVYAPGNLSDPIGQGTMQRATGRLVWAGGHWQSEGDWLARVTNNNPTTVQYTLTSSAHAIQKQSCYSYWENLPTGQRVYWTECQ